MVLDQFPVLRCREVCGGQSSQIFNVLSCQYFLSFMNERTELSFPTCVAACKIFMQLFQSGCLCYLSDFTALFDSRKQKKLCETNENFEVLMESVFSIIYVLLADLG